GLARTGCSLSEILPEAGGTGGRREGGNGACSSHGGLLLRSPGTRANDLAGPVRPDENDLSRDHEGRVRAPANRMAQSKSGPPVRTTPTRSASSTLQAVAGSALAVEQCCQVKFPLTRSSPRPCSRAPVRCVPRRNPRSAGGPPVESRHGRCERDEHERRTRQVCRAGSAVLQGAARTRRADGGAPGRREVSVAAADADSRR